MAGTKSEGKYTEHSVHLEISDVIGQCSRDYGTEENAQRPTHVGYTYGAGVTALGTKNARMDGLNLVDSHWKRAVDRGQRTQSGRKQARA